MFDGLPHGMGILKWFDGNRYEGEFKYGKIEGTGTYYYKNGGNYTGSWVNG